MWFYHCNTVNFIDPFVKEQINLDLLQIIRLPTPTQKSDTCFSWVSVTEPFKIMSSYA